MELVSGKVVVHMPVGASHGELALWLGSLILGFVRKNLIGTAMVETGFRLRANPDTVLAPDVSVVRSEQFPSGRVPEGFIEGLPLLAVEVVSPNDSRKEVLAKVGEYLDCGVSRVWVVREKDRTVIVYGQDDHIKVVPTDGLLTSEDAGFETPGFELPVADIFR